MHPAKHPEDIQAIEVGHHHVQKDHVEGMSSEKRERLPATFDGRHRVPIQLQPLGEHVPVQFFIVHDEERCRSSGHPFASRLSRVSIFSSRR